MRWLITIDAVTRNQIGANDSLQPGVSFISFSFARSLQHSLHSSALMRRFVRQLVQCTFSVWIFRIIWLLMNVGSTAHSHIFGIKFVLLQPRFDWGRTTIPSIWAPANQISLAKIPDQHRQHVILWSKICEELNGLELVGRVCFFLLLVFVLVLWQTSDKFMHFILCVGHIKRWDRGWRSHPCPLCIFNGFLCVLVSRLWMALKCEKRRCR